MCTGLYITCRPILDSEAYDDLEKAILLSNSVGKTASLAFVQRGLLRKLDGDDESSLEDFKKAAALGNDFAKQQVGVKLLHSAKPKYHTLTFIVKVVLVVSMCKDL